jgi:hypothetical protein
MITPPGLSTSLHERQRANAPLEGRAGRERYWKIRTYKFAFVVLVLAIIAPVKFIASGL